MAIAAARKTIDASASYRVTQFTIHEALVLTEEQLSTIQTILTRTDNGASFQILSLDQADLDQNGESWKLHASGQVVVDALLPQSDSTFAPADVQARCVETIDGAAYYERIRTLGLEFGSSFQGIRQVWRRDGEALGEVTLPAELVSERATYLFHPALLDSCFHLLGAPLPDELETSYLLIGIDSYRQYHAPGSRLWNHTVIQDMSGETFTGDIYLYNEEGTLIAEVSGLQLKRASREALLRAVHRRPDDWFYQVIWGGACTARISRKCSPNWWINKWISVESWATCLRSDPVDGVTRLFNLCQPRSGAERSIYRASR